MMSLGEKRDKCQHYLSKNKKIADEANGKVLSLAVYRAIKCEHFAWREPPLNLMNDPEKKVVSQIADKAVEKESSPLKEEERRVLAEKIPTLAQESVTVPAAGVVDKKEQSVEEKEKQTTKYIVCPDPTCNMKYISDGYNYFTGKKPVTIEPPSYSLTEEGLWEVYIKDMRASGLYKPSDKLNRITTFVLRERGDAYSAFNLFENYFFDQVDIPRICAFHQEKYITENAFSLQVEIEGECPELLHRTRFSEYLRPIFIDGAGVSFDYVFNSIAYRQKFMTDESLVPLFLYPLVQTLLLLTLMGHKATVVLPQCYKYLLDEEESLKVDDLDAFKKLCQNGCIIFWEEPLHKENEDWSISDGMEREYSKIGAAIVVPPQVKGNMEFTTAMRDYISVNPEYRGYHSEEQGEREVIRLVEFPTSAPLCRFTMMCVTVSCWYDDFVFISTSSCLFEGTEVVECEIESEKEDKDKDEDEEDSEGEKAKVEVKEKKETNAEAEKEIEGEEKKEKMGTKTVFYYLDIPKDVKLRYTPFSGDVMDKQIKIDNQITIKQQLDVILDLIQLYELPISHMHAVMVYFRYLYKEEICIEELQFFFNKYPVLPPPNPSEALRAQVKYEGGGRDGKKTKNPPNCNLPLDLDTFERDYKLWKEKQAKKADLQKEFLKNLAEIEQLRPSKARSSRTPAVLAISTPTREETKLDAVEIELPSKAFSVTFHNAAASARAETSSSSRQTAAEPSAEKEKEEEGSSGGDE